MNLDFDEFPFVLLTPAMIGGARGAQGDAEMRVASIRGQIRWWHRQSGIVPACNQIWGQTEGGVVASKIALTLNPRAPVPQAAPKPSILPHKDRAGGNRSGLDAGETFTLRLTRLVGCTENHWTAAQATLKVWLLLGGIGLRANRAAGSVWPLDPADPAKKWVPQTDSELASLLKTLRYPHPVLLADSNLLNDPSLASEPSDSLKLRHAASNTVDGFRDLFGGINPRLGSPVKMKVIRLGHKHRLLLTANNSSLLSAAHSALSRKPLGKVPWGTIS